MGPLMKDRTVVLVTHHVELVLPGAQYLVRMLDGRIDQQGTIKDLRASGALEDIELEAAVEEREAVEERGEEEEVKEGGVVDEVDGVGGEGRDQGQGKGKKKPRKLIKEEERETGGVKWKIYNAYLKAS